MFTRFPIAVRVGQDGVAQPLPARALPLEPMPGVMWRYRRQVDVGGLTAEHNSRLTMLSAHDKDVIMRDTKSP